MKTAKELKGSRLVAKVRLHNYRFPRSKIESGNYAIIVFDVISIVEGQLPIECEMPTSPGSYQFIGVGNMPKIEPGSEYIFQGSLIIDKQWGPQYEVEAVRLNYDLDKEEDQRKFFSYFMTDRQVDLLFNECENPIDYLESKNIGELTKIKGIGPMTASRMCMRYEECKNNGRAYIALKGLDLSKQAIDKLIKRYGSADIVVDKIEDNPYILIKEVRGYGWKKADAIALKKGFSRDCKERVLAFSQYYLDSQGETNGNSWVTIDELLLAITVECSPVLQETAATWLKEVMMSDADFEEYYEMMLEDRVTGEPPLLFYEKANRRVGLFELRVLEKNIARHIQRLQEAKNTKTYYKKIYKKIIKEVEAEQGYEYTDEQRNAIWNILENNVTILTGSAGTGKSSTLAAATRIFKHYKQKIDQCALSGRASSLLNEITKIPGKTIHRLLSYMPDFERFAFNERNNLHSDVIILDETSMVGGELFYSLISAIKTGAKFIMLGDTHQLEAIGMANILKDCLTSGYIRAAVLTKIHRQAARSGIISQSILVSNGESIVKNDFSGSEIRGELQDFKIVASYDSGLVQHNIINEFKYLYFKCMIPIEDIQIIVPMKTRGDISCRVLNSRIQEMVNPSSSKKEVYVDFTENGVKYSVCFRPNDRIIVTRNNYHALGLDGEEKQIFNGNIGYIKDISSDAMIVNLPEVEDVILPKEEWHCIQLAYAITVHKKQGDSVPYAILGIDSSCYALLSRELVYTAITRARKFCTLVTQPKALNTAVKISRVRLKQTWLKDDLFQLYLAQQKKAQEGE